MPTINERVRRWSPTRFARCNYRLDSRREKAPRGKRSGQRLLDRSLNELCGSAEAQTAQLLDHSDSLLACRHDVLTSVDCLEHGRDLPHLGRRHVAEDIAVPMHNAALPGRIGEELGRALGKTHTGIGYDQPNAVEAALLEMCEECASCT
jgi:hypothetical protein